MSPQRVMAGRWHRLVPVLAILLAVPATAPLARHASAPPTSKRPQVSNTSPVSLDAGNDVAALNASAAQGTTWLASYTFDQGGSCVDEGWTTVDLTAQDADYWHVDDFSSMGANFQGHTGVLGGFRSLWCGARESTTNPLCGYASLPGYGNNWNQAFCTTDCVNTGNGAVITFDADWDSEPGYDATTLEVTNCTGGSSDENWIKIAGGINDWDYNLDMFSTNGDTTITVGIADSLHAGGSLRVRFHFVADGGWSDSDGLWDTDGAFVIDNLSLSGLNGGAAEDFEGESVGATATDDGAWSSCTPAGYGSLAALSSGFDLLQRDECIYNPTCMWSFLEGSTADYTCGGYPAQTAIPYENQYGQYIDNGVVSPDIPISGSGVKFELAFDVYRDLRLDALIFYQWHIASVTGGCTGQWKDRNFVFYSPFRDWFRQVEPIGDLIDGGAQSLKIRLNVIDMCPFWCGSVGSGQCHSNSPLFDNVDLYRIVSEGPQFATRDLEFFQDTFAADGTTTGTARMDMANDLLPSSNPNFHSGDSMTVTVADPDAGLAGDAFTGFGAAVYGYFALDRGAAAHPADASWSDDGRYPVVDNFNLAGRHWVVLRCDTSFTNGAARTGAQPDKFAVDLNDDLFVPGDTVSFFWGARNTNGVWTYHSQFTGGTNDQSLAASNPNEVTVLPAGGVNNGGDILYVDGMDGRGAQPFFDSAFQMMGLLDQVDRYDIRAPSSGVANRPGARVVDVFQQILPFYRKIIWNTGNLDNGLIGDGSVWGEKSDDAGMLLSFLDNLAQPGGVYFNGDNIAEEWPTLTNSAVPLRDTYIQHTLVDPDHVGYGLGTNPYVIGENGGCFYHVTGPDTLIAYGGCPLPNDFDIISPAGASVLEAHYQSGVRSGGAIVSQYTENLDSVQVGVILSGFSFHYITDYAAGGAGSVPARAHHMHDILVWLGNQPPEPVAAAPTYRNALGQNYPNPFNPQTTIEFTVKELAPVSMKIYNVRGALVKTLVNNDRFTPGEPHAVTWDGRNNAGQQVSSGVYFYKLVTKEFTQTKKMVLLK